MRPSHGSWNTGSFSSSGMAPIPCMPPISCTPFTSSPLAGSNGADADHRVARHECGELAFAQMLGSGGTLRQHQIPDFGGAVPYAHLHFVGQVDAELAQDASRVDD